MKAKQCPLCELLANSNFTWLSLCKNCAKKCLCHQTLLTQFFLGSHLFTKKDKCKGFKLSHEEIQKLVSLTVLWQSVSFWKTPRKGCLSGMFYSNKTIAARLLHCNKNFNLFKNISQKMEDAYIFRPSSG